MSRTCRNCLFIAAMAFAVTLLNACSLLERPLEEPEFRVDRVSILELGASEQRFRITLAVDNPNPHSLRVREIRYALQLGGLELAEGQSTSAFTLAAEDTTTVDLDARTQLLGSLPGLMRMAYSGRRTFDYKLTGEVAYGRFFRGSQGFSRNGSLELLLD